MNSGVWLWPLSGVCHIRQLRGSIRSNRLIWTSSFRFSASITGLRILTCAAMMVCARLPCVQLSVFGRKSACDLFRSVCMFKMLDAFSDVCFRAVCSRGILNMRPGSGAARLSAGCTYGHAVADPKQHSGSCNHAGGIGIVSCCLTCGWQNFVDRCGRCFPVRHVENSCGVPSAVCQLFYEHIS